jgi:hypothetical protein
MDERSLRLSIAKKTRSSREHADLSNAFDTNKVYINVLAVVIQSIYGYNNQDI